MSTPIELWKNWEGRVIDGSFPLLRWLGGSDHSAVFLTNRGGNAAQKSVIKLLPANNLDEDAQLSLWRDAAKLSHPHLIQLFECGRYQLDGARLLYVVMECADESLAEVIPLRPLEPAEVSEMLAPTAQALAFLHRAGRVHGSVKPSNIMAVDNQLKISADAVHKIGTQVTPRGPGAYRAPEVSSEGLSPSADVWSLGATLVVAFTQHEPDLRVGNAEAVVPEILPEPFREIARRCLRADSRRRCTIGDILKLLQGDATPPSAGMDEQPAPKAYSGRWIVAVIVVAALVLLAFAGSKLVNRPRVAAPPEPSFSQPPPVHAETPTTPSPAPLPPKENHVSSGNTRGSVLQQVLPEVSRSAQNTITGKVKVTVRVAVNASGNVSQATLASPGPSRYFANQSLGAARRWKFNSPQVGGQPAASEWLLRFQFGRGSTQVFPTQVSP